LIEKTASAQAAYAMAFAVASIWFTLAAALVNRVKIAVH
jgi:hypothetical protein